jgi:ankyrin repeat protein
MIEDPKQYLLEQLIDAVLNNNLKDLHYFLNLGVNPNGYLDHAQMTPLHFAASNGHDQAARLLLFNGADPGARTFPELETPRHIADQLGHHAVAEFMAASDPQSTHTTETQGGAS